MFPGPVHHLNTKKQRIVDVGLKIRKFKTLEHSHFNIMARSAQVLAVIAISFDNHQDVDRDHK